jgi:hypothetical protein
MFDADQFMSEANSAYLTSSGQRYGQFLVNQLATKQPEIQLPDVADCFYDDMKVPAFLDHIYTLSDSMYRETHQ